MGINTKYTETAAYHCLEYPKKKSVELYLSYCGKEICEPSHTYGPAARQEFLLHYVLSGKGTFTLADSTSFSLKKHDAFLIYPGEITSYTSDAENPWIYTWIAFDGVRALEYISHAGFSKRQRILSFESESQLVSCVESILAAHQLTYSDDLIRQSKLIYFFAVLCKEHQERSALPAPADYPHQAYADYAIEYIEHNYHRNIRVTDISAYIGIDRSYLTKIFKKVLGISPQQYLLNLRMNEAAGLLDSTNLPVSQIAGLCGYSDALAFSKAFKSKLGVCPSAYRSSKDSLILSVKKNG